MKMHSDFHMAQGETETSYVNNSRLQRGMRYYSSTLPENLVASDLGCSSGENTLIFISGVINATRGLPLELQFFLNDLPGNDFNHIFQSLQQFKKSISEDHKEETLPPFYVAGLPGSYYTRLFPCRSVHLFHSSYSLHWLSRLPDGLEGNEGNICITKTTPLSVVERYQLEQFRKDFMLFLQLRNEELVFGGQMVLTFLGRKDDNVCNGNLNYLTELLAQSLWSLVDKGLVEKDKVKFFNLPIYGAAVNEVTTVIKKSKLFDINQIKLFESNWDPYDDLDDDVVQDNIRSGENISKSIRAVMETLLASHFGESVLDALFNEYACKVAEHLKWHKTKYSVIVLSLEKR
ncbi:hypothetical protein EJB05_55358, partial [Eragrostis curvula]